MRSFRIPGRRYCVPLSTRCPCNSIRHRDRDASRRRQTKVCKTADFMNQFVGTSLYRYRIPCV